MLRVATVISEELHVNVLDTSLTKEFLSEDELIAPCKAAIVLVERLVGLGHVTPDSSTHRDLVLLHGCSSTDSIVRPLMA